MITRLQLIKARACNDEAVCLITTDTQEVSLYASELMHAAQLLGDALLSAIESAEPALTIEVTP